MKTKATWPDKDPSVEPESWSSRRDKDVRDRLVDDVMSGDCEIDDDGHITWHPPFGELD